MYCTAWSLLPPLTVLFIALTLRTMNLAFFSGIITAAYIASHGSIEQALTTSFNRLKSTATDYDNLFLYGFLIFIGSLIVLFNKTGSLTKLTAIATARLKNGRQAQFASIIFSLLLFVDDYLSILTTGYVVQPIAQRFGIPRVKIAYLIHSLAGSVVILAPISSWVATITAQLGQAGINPLAEKATYMVADPFFIYLKTIPYMLYSFLTILSVFFIVRFSISYGPMREYEEKHVLASFNHSTAKTDYSSLWGILLPFIVLLATMFFGILYSGSFWLLGGNNNLIDALKCNTSPFFIMFLAALSALITEFIIGIYNKKCSLVDTPSIIFGGWQLMKEAILMVFLSSTLALMLKGDICTGQYLASLFIDSVSLWLLPALFFCVSLICALATGSAWGTFSLMLSIAVPMVIGVLNATIPADPGTVGLLFPVFGAIFSGAVCGDHISPMSETTIMASTSCGTPPIIHAYTQFPYALPAIISSILAFLVVGYCVTNSYPWCSLIALSAAIPTCLGIILLFNYYRNVKAR